MRSKSLIPSPSAQLLILGAALAACGSPTSDDGEPARTAAAGGGLAVVDEDPIDYEACAEISEAAASLIDATATCDQRFECEAIPAVDVMPSTCIPSISCYIAASQQSDIEPVIGELQALELEYREECGLCPTVDCLPAERVDARCESGRCDLVPRSRPQLVNPGR